MSNPSHTLVPLSTRHSQPLAVAPSRAAFGLSENPPQEPSALWRLVTRYYKWLSIYAVGALLIALFVGWSYARPVWQVDTVLLYRPVTLTAEQQVAFPTAPSLPTLASWLKEPKFLLTALPDCGVKMAPANFAEYCLKVDQPVGTEVVTVICKWSDRDTCRDLADKLIQRYMEFVVTERKKAILQGAHQTKLQELALCQSEMHRLETYISDLQVSQTRNGGVSAAELDGALMAHRNDLPINDSWKSPFGALESSMMARRIWFEDQILKDQQQIAELQTKLQKELSDYRRNAELAKSGEAPFADVENSKSLCDFTNTQIRHAEERIKKYNDDLRNLPINQAQTIRSASRWRGEFLQDELRQLNQALDAIQRPGAPLVHRVLTGMDAREFKVQSMSMEDYPISSNRRTLTAMTFLGLMGLGLSLLFAFDRYSAMDGSESGPRPGGILRTRLVHVAGQGSGGVTIARVDVQRLSVRIHQWIRGDEVPHDVSDMMIGPGGSIDEARQLPAPASADVEMDPLAARIHHWLEREPGEGK